MDVIQIIQIIYTVFAGIFGLVIGSFLNVCIYRIPEGRTIVKGHSMCMSCGHELGPLDLVPLFSWIFLKRKCRYCGAPIASRYAKIEGLTGIVFAVLAWQRRASYYLPDSSEHVLIQFFVLIILFMLAAAVIVSMMIQKDHRTGMYRLSASVFSLLAIRIFLCLFDRAALMPVVISVSAALLISAAVLLLIIILSAFVMSPRTAFSDIFTGRTFKSYFDASNRTIRTTDLLFLGVSASVGFPAVIFCAAAYFAVWIIRKQELLLPYMGIIIAASAFLGIIIFPGNVF